MPRLFWAPFKQSVDYAGMFMSHQQLASNEIKRLNSNTYTDLLSVYLAIVW
jgi:hypothetical protein